MEKNLLSTRRWLLALIGAVMTCAAWAAEPFVTFEQTAGSGLLKDVTIGYAAQEHSCVQLAAANLQKDFETVTGSKPAISEAKPSILIGTVGVNPQINQWVKQGVLSNLKGKTEKYIIKTIDGQLVIAGSDKRGTV